MIAELGLFSLILALVFALFLVLIPSIGLWRNNQGMQDSAPIYLCAQFVFVALSYFFLTLCFLHDDFSLSYVMANSSHSLPWFYKLCAVWGGHEGSMLLWVAILSLWMLAVCFFSKRLVQAFRVRVFIVLGALSVGFILFILSTSNPFFRLFDVVVTQGRDLNPLLQDPGFLFHPPMLYMGYVGFAVAFAFAIAALWLGRVEALWVQWTRPWTLAAWCCLTAGITLGSWWAYRELGWGGWWFWDPVENASFMPWLVGTALLHSLAVSEQRRQFMAWTMLLAITGFSLSLVGTFLVRSGILSSVHAFAVDPARGLYILLFLLCVIGGSLFLFALRAHTLVKPQKAELVSRESALLLNNVFLVVAMLTILMGTLYPLMIDALGLGKLSVGAPYFNAVFVPLMIPVFVLMGIGIHCRWQREHIKNLMNKLAWLLILSILLPLLCLFFLQKKILFSAYLGLGLAFWILLSSGYWVYLRIKTAGWQSMHQRFWAMIVAHLGVAVAIIGVSVSSQYGVQEDVVMRPGDLHLFAGYTVHFVEEKALHGPNYHGSRTQFLIGEKAIYPEKRIYDVARMVMTDSAIDVNPFRDIYIALGEAIGKDAWFVRIYYKPFVRWIWAGGFMILVGGLLALSDRRYWSSSKECQVRHEI